MELDKQREHIVEYFNDNRFILHSYALVLHKMRNGCVITQGQFDNLIHLNKRFDNPNIQIMLTNVIYKILIKHEDRG